MRAIIHQTSDIKLPSRRPKPPLEHAHQPVEHEADEANRNDRENDVLVNETVVFLPEKAAHAGTARQHFGRDDYEPGNPETQPETREHIRQRRRNEDPGEW